LDGHDLMEKPVKSGNEFFLYQYDMPDGMERVVPMQHVAFNGELPPEVDKQYLNRFGEKEKARLHVLPIKGLGAVTMGALHGVETGKTVIPGRDMGNALILQKPVTQYTQRAIGQTRYVCLFPKDDTYYQRKLHHNIEGLPDEPGFHEPVTEDLAIPARDGDQFVFVAAGRVSVLGGSTFSEYSLLKIKGGTGERLIGFIEPGTIVIHAWRG
jgi:hypothetical protein